MSEHLISAPIVDIFNDTSFNCRGKIIPLDVMTLAQNLKEHGLLQPIAIQPWDKTPGKKWRIIVGHRRYEAAKQLGWETINAIVKEGLTEAQALALNLIENVERKQLNLLQEAHAVNRFRLIGMTHREIAEAVRMSPGWVQVRLAVMDLPIEIQNEAAAGMLTTEHIKTLAGMSREDQFAAVRTIKDASLNGEKIKLKVDKQKKEKGSVKKVRTLEAVHAMQDHIIDTLGNNLATRALGWAAGHISNLEFAQSLKVFASQTGKHYEIPDEYLGD